MTDTPPGAFADRDLASIAQARDLVRRAHAAQQVLAEFSQSQVDAIVAAMARRATEHAEPLARLAVEETGFGRVEDKIRKNLFASDRVFQFIRDLPTVGIVARDPVRRLVEIAEPFGVVAAIVPSTNPTSTTIYKALIAIKARCAIVFSPHPAAEGCISRTTELLAAAAGEAGLPEGAMGCMTRVTLEGTQELMRHRHVAVILATGGLGLVRAAYSAGKPAYGVGPGNAPAYIERTADVPKAVADIIAGKTFDNGVLCSAENSVVVDAVIADQVRAEFIRQGGVFLDAGQAARLAAVLVTPQRLPNPDLVGRSALHIAERIGLTVPPSTKVLLAELAGVGRDHPLSIEKLCPVLSFYVVRDWEEGCERCKQILRYGGMGHTLAIHSRDETVIEQFGLRKPASRIVVNTPATLGAIGFTTGLDPAMTLGCGGYGGNITSDNITPRHLLNLKRLAYEVTPYAAAPLREQTATSDRALAASQPPSGRQLDNVEPTVSPATDDLMARVDSFLASRGWRPKSPSAPGPAAAREPGSEQTGVAEAPEGPARHAPAGAGSEEEASVPEPMLDFVCEEDVRRAIRTGRRLRLAPHAIVTPAARDLAEEFGVFE